MVTAVKTGSGQTAAPLSKRVTIIGAGIAGTLTAILLDRAGCDVTIIESLKVHPKEFRAEQVISEDELRNLGLLDAVVGNIVAVRQSRTFRTLWRWGWLTKQVGGPHYGLRYDEMINRARRHLPASVEFVNERVEEIQVSDDTQQITLRNGRVIESRLIVMATGLHSQLLGKLGMTRKMLGKEHSLAIGFDLKVDCHEKFRSSVLTVYGNNWLGGDRGGAIDYATFFLIGNSLRGNIFTNGKCIDEWTRAFKAEPIKMLLKAMPWLEQQTGKIIEIDNLKVRPSDLTILENHLQPGVVCVGDTYLSPCPATGTGISRMLTEIELLGTQYIPQWLETPGMDAERIAAFYGDERKVAADQASLRDAMYHRAITRNRGIRWIVRRIKTAATELLERASRSRDERRVRKELRFERS